MTLCSCCVVKDLLKDGKDLGRDASGNAILADVGPWLRDQFRNAFKVRTCCVHITSRQCYIGCDGRTARHTSVPLASHT